MKHVRRLFLIAVCALTATMTTGAQSGWTPLWNGKNLDGWTTWMRQPEPTSEVPGLARGTRRQIHRADRIRPRSAEGLHRRG